MKKETEKNLTGLFTEWSGEKVKSIALLPRSGSGREYYRICGQKGEKALGVYNDDETENRAFIEFSRHFLKQRMNVPAVYSENKKKYIYLIQDLGDTTLYAYLSALPRGKSFPDSVLKWYKKAIDHLLKFQISGGRGLDYSLCCPRSKFDKQSMMWDLNYFKYCFLKLVKNPFSEQKLEDDFHTLTDYLLSADCDYFMYRDFQSRNIMMFQNDLYFIDYQGGRKGSLHYDLASLLFDAKADLPQKTRDILLDYYISQLKNYKKTRQDEFTGYFYGYAMLRILQALGAYGYRGMYEQKAHFLKSIPYALTNIRWIMENHPVLVKLPCLKKILEQLAMRDDLFRLNTNTADSKLTVTITSFSYLKGIPLDMNGNGGGFAFDCRSLDNPGKYEQYKQYTGLDKPVIDFFKHKNDIKTFLENVNSLIDHAVQTYLERSYSNLMVGFGCTGGQHRSVYCAKILASRLRKNKKINVVLHHRELEQ